MNRAEQKAATRQRILDVAHAAFQARGYDATTLQVVADGAGVAVGTVVAHFPDKPALVAAAFHADIDAAVARAWRTPEHPDLVERLVGIAGELYAFYATNHPLYRRMFQESLFFGPGPLRDQLDAFTEAVAGEVACRRPDLPAVIAAHGFFADYLYVLIGGFAGAIPTVEAQCAVLRGLLDLRLR